MQTSLPNSSVQTVQLTDFRGQVGEILNQVHYQGMQVKLMRKNVGMARLVSERYAQAIEAMLDNDPALADTLALMLNSEAQDVLSQGMAEYKRGQMIPLVK